MTLLTIYLTGLILFPWFFWFAGDWTSPWWHRVVESVFWPLAIIVGSVRKIWKL